MLPPLRGSFLLRSLIYKRCRPDGALPLTRMSHVKFREVETGLGATIRNVLLLHHHFPNGCFPFRVAYFYKI
jgi:hypothetical protein